MDATRARKKIAAPFPGVPLFHTYEHAHAHAHAHAHSHAHSHAHAHSHSQLAQLAQLAQLTQLAQLALTCTTHTHSAGRLVHREMLYTLTKTGKKRKVFPLVKRSDAKFCSITN